LTLDGAREMIAAVERAGVFFQMLFNAVSMPGTWRQSRKSKKALSVSR